MSGARSELPPWWRILLAFALAPAVAAFAFSCVSPMYEGLTNVFQRIIKTFPAVLLFGGYLPTLVAGLPTYALLRSRRRPTLLNCAVVGASVAGVPWLLLTILPAADSASIDGVATVMNHHVTPFGVWVGLKMAFGIGLFGALGGATFWAIAAGRVAQPNFR